MPPSPAETHILPADTAVVLEVPNSAKLKFCIPSTRALALRAQVLCELKRPNAAIHDANRALELNSDSAPALRWRGKAKALKGDW